MKAKTIRQKQIIALSQKLSPISDTQRDWAYQHCIEHHAHRTKKGITTCLECACSWENKDFAATRCVCPHCGKKLAIVDTRVRNFKQIQYFCIVTVCHGFQVLRFFYIQADFKVGNSARYFCREAVQRWIAPNGKSEVVALLRGMSVVYNDIWDFNSTLEIRPNRDVYDIPPIQVYPRRYVTTEIKRNGFKGNFCGLTPFELFRSLLTDSRCETLLKAEQYSMLQCFSRSQLSVTTNYWESIKICIRNHYIIEDASLWRDYISLLKFCRKDVRNAKYICPQDLKTEHDRLMKKKQECQDRERMEQQRKKAQEDEKRFQELKARFFGISFTDGTIQVRVLESVEDFYEEGNRLRHCVFTNGYYLKPDSLILSAHIGTERIETVEVSLKTMKVVQSYGVCNSNTKYHDQIIQLVNKSASLIRKRLTA